MNGNSPSLKLVHESYHTTLIHAHARIAPFLVGPAGCGKTTIAEQISKEMDVPFYYTGAVESSFMLRGFRDSHGQVQHTPFRTAYEKGGVFLFDELDASDPQAIVSLHAAMDNGVLDAPDGMIPMHKDFILLAAGNTWGHGATLNYIGRTALDGATLDRYSFIPVGYDPKLEAAMAGENLEPTPRPEIKKIELSDEQKQAWRILVQQARVSCDELKLQHIVSSRPIVNGLKLLAYGLSVEDVFRYQVLKGLPEGDIVKVNNAVKNKLGKVPELEALKKANDGLDGLTDLLGQFTQVGKQINEISSRAQDVSQQALAKTGEASGLIQEVSTQIASLQSSLTMLRGIEGALPGVVRAADRAITELKRRALSIAVQHPKRSKCYVRINRKRIR
jgi:cobaltochelatase CobS